MDPHCRTRSGRIVKKPERYEPAEIPTDDFDSDEYDSDDYDAGDEDVSLVSEDEDELEASDDDSFIDDSD